MLGQSTDVSKLKWYTTKNINKVCARLNLFLSLSYTYSLSHTHKHYDEMVKLLCDRWKIAKRVSNPTPGGPEVEFDCDPNRVIFLDETACRDRKEQKRISKVLARRLTRAANRKFARRSFGQNQKGSIHETVVTGFTLKGEVVPPVWVINVERITNKVCLGSRPRTHKSTHTLHAQSIRFGRRCATQC